MAIDKNSKAYQSLLNSGYTDEQIMQMHQQVASWQNASQVVANTPKGTSSSPKSNYQNQWAGNYVYNSNTWYYENTSNRSNNTTNQNLWASNSNSWSSRVRSSSYQNQGAGNYTYNPTSWYYEKQQSQTSTPASSWWMDATRQYWEWLSYEQQQEKFNQIPWLKESVTKKWWNVKSAGWQWQTWPTQTQSNPWQWDYQDNSDARMYEMANNLNGYRVSNPELFSDWNTFSNFFINGKWRSQEQIDFLKSYFNAVKQYNSYDNMSAPTVWEMVAKWEIPDDYLNYLKYANPNRYAEVMNYKDTTEKWIMNETYYSNLIANSNDPDWMKWAKENDFLIDENKDNLDDRLYHAPTEEEQNLVTEYSTLASEQLADQNTYRDLMADLREQYPDADESTLMILAWDRGKKIQDRMDTRNVTMTKLWGQITYLQNERNTQNTAWQQTINQLQKAFWMYYDYTAEWMAEMAQNQFAATNVTLDQADNWTDAQKQMALQSVLDDYYDKYWSIIQRSEAQVINDVMAYARNNWVTLSQALEENFLKPLRAKPQFSTLSSGGELWWTPKIYKIWDNRYWYFDQNGNLIEIWDWGVWGGYWGDYSWDMSSDVSSFVSDLESKWYKIAGNGWTGGSTIRWGGCWTVCNDYLKSIWDTTASYGNDKQSKLDSITPWAWPQVWAVAVWDHTWTEAWNKYWHVAIVTWVDTAKGTITVLESNAWTWLRYNTYKMSWVTGYHIPPNAQSWWSWWNNNLEDLYAKFADIGGDRLKEKDFWAQRWDTIKKSWVSEKDFLKQQKEWYAYASKDAYVQVLADLDHLIEMTWPNFSKSARAWVQLGVWTTASVYNNIRNNLTLNKIIEAKNSGAKLWVLSDSDVKMLKEAASTLDWSDNQATWNAALQAYRNSILNSNKYLKQKYEYQSARSPSNYIHYNNNNKSYSIVNGSKSSSSGSNNSSWSRSSSWGKKITNLGR